MNNKFYSQAVTMTFLAVWHGFHSGYYLTFFNEILVMQFEKQFIPLCQRNPTLSKLWEDSLIAKALFIVIGKVSWLFNWLLPLGAYLLVIRLGRFAIAPRSMLRRA